MRQVQIVRKHGCTWRLLVGRLGLVLPHTRGLPPVSAEERLDYHVAFVRFVLRVGRWRRHRAFRIRLDQPCRRANLDQLLPIYGVLASLLLMHDQLPVLLLGLLMFISHFGDCLIDDGELLLLCLPRLADLQLHRRFLDIIVRRAANVSLPTLRGAGLSIARRADNVRDSTVFSDSCEFSLPTVRFLLHDKRLLMLGENGTAGVVPGAFRSFGLLVLDVGEELARCQGLLVRMSTAVVLHLVV